MWNQGHTNSNGAETLMSMTEFGATVLIYLNKSLNWKFSGTYMSVNGTRKTGAVEETSKEMPCALVFGYHAPITDAFAIGGTLSYQVTSLTSSIINNTETKIDQTYSQIIPMIELAWRY